LAALEVHSGQIRAQTIRRNNSDTFIGFWRRLLQAYPEVELYVIVDNGSPHISQKTRACPRKSSPPEQASSSGSS